MSYHTDERGVRKYSDFETPPEYATSTDENRAAWYEALRVAFSASENVYGAIDNLSLIEDSDKHQELLEVAATLNVLLAKIAAISGSASA